jgi:hypothetical protein
MDGARQFPSPTFDRVFRIEVVDSDGALQQRKSADTG